MTLLFHNDLASEAVARWGGTNPHLKPMTHDFQLPGQLRAEIEAMRAEWTKALRDDPGPALFRERTLAHPTEPGWRALISMTALRFPHFGKPSFVIRFETPSDRAKNPLATLVRLTAREQKLVKLVSDGQSNQEIAEALGRSLNTVKSELHAVFRKLGIPSRARLMALLR